MTTLLTSLVTRWSSPACHPRRVPRLAVATVPALAFFAAVFSLFSPGGFDNRYYLSMIVWWAAVPLTLLWWGTARSWSGMLGRPKGLVWLASLLLPTVYLCSADVYALRRGTWHIAESKSLGIFAVPDLPIEEAFFFFVTNLILISASFAFDRVIYECRRRTLFDSRANATPLSPSFMPLNLESVLHLWNSFVELDQDRSSKSNEAEASLRAAKAKEHAVKILLRASKSFHAAAKLLPWDLREDLSCLYALARAMDDYVDDPCTADESKPTPDGRSRIAMLRTLIEATFDPNASRTEIEKRLQHFSDDVLGTGSARHRIDLVTSAIAVCDLRFIVPVSLWQELIDGYAIDLGEVTSGPSQFTIFEHQAHYAQCVAGSIGEMCTRVVLARSGVLVSRDYKVARVLEKQAMLKTKSRQRESLKLPSLTISKGAKPMAPEIVAEILEDARAMGVSLQLVNIARDVVKDSLELRRCYLVVTKADDWIRQGLSQGHLALQHQTKEEEQVETLLTAGEKLVTMDEIYARKLELLDVAQALFAATYPTVAKIPSAPARSGLRAACSVYAAIADVIRREGPAGCEGRSRSSNWERAKVAFRAVYCL